MYPEEAKDLVVVLFFLKKKKLDVIKKADMV